MDPRFAGAINRFAFRIASELFQPEAPANVFFSPCSIHAALAMTLNGANGATFTAMQEALQLTGQELAAINRNHAGLRELLQAAGAGIELRSANALWGNQEATFREDFLESCRADYMAKIESLDFRQSAAAAAHINAWVNEQTSGRIQNLLQAGDLGASTLLALTNAIYFKGLWQKSFDAARTRQGRFHLADGSEKDCQFMLLTEQFPYLETDGFQAASLPYGDGRFSMYIFLPTKHASIQRLIAQLSAENWSNWLSQSTPTRIELGLPRFRLEYEKELSQALSALGMGIAFSSQADFSAMCDRPAFISQARHKAFLEVNEAGSEAAAATAVIMARGAAPKLPRLIIDRPFFCAIYDQLSGVLLFCGVVMEPSQ